MLYFFCDLILPIYTRINGPRVSTAAPKNATIGITKRSGKQSLYLVKTYRDRYVFLFFYKNLQKKNIISTNGVISILELEEKILKEGKVLPGNVLKVDSFLNHRIDAAFTMKMGKEIAKLYKDSQINKIVTIETSAIPIAFAAAYAMEIPMVFAKKNKSKNISPSVYSSRVMSFTHGNEYDAVISRDYLSSDDKVLVIDDFLATGSALCGLLDIVKQAGAEVTGCAIGIEKGFQGAGDKLRASGIRVESLAIVDSMSENSLVFRH